MKYSTLYPTAYANQKKKQKKHNDTVAENMLKLKARNRMKGARIVKGKQDLTKAFEEADKRNSGYGNAVRLVELKTKKVLKTKPPANK